MIGWILAGLAAATVYNVAKDSNNNNSSGKSPSPKNVKLRCRNCGNELIVADTVHVEGTCPKCHGNYIVENGIMRFKGMITVPCISCGREVKVPGGEYVEAKCEYCGASFNVDRGKVYRNTSSTTKVNSTTADKKDNSESAKTKSCSGTTSNTYDISQALYEATANGNINKEKLREIYTEIVRNYNRNPSSSLVYKDLDYGMNMLWRYDVPIWVPFYEELPMTVQVMVQESDGIHILNSIGVFTEEKYIESEIRTNVKKVGFKYIIDLLKKDYFDNYGLVSFNSTQRGVCEWTISKEILLELCREGGGSRFTIS